MPAARALAPVDLAGAVAIAIGPVLPEGIALADPAPAVHALDHRGGDAVGRDHQRRQGAGELERTMKGWTAGPSAPGAAMPRPDYAIRAHIWAITVSTVTPSARAEKFTAMRWRRIGPASATTSSTDGASRPWMMARARAASMKAWLARGPGPQATRWRTTSRSDVLGTAGAHQLQDGIDHALADRQAADQRLRRHQVRRRQRLHGDRHVGAGGRDHDLALGRLVGIADIDLQQEAVELGFGQGIGAFLLQRVLRGEHVERRRQVVALAGDGDVLLLHRLQQRRLGARAGAVDFVGHQQLGEDRALDEAEGAAAAVALLQHFGAQDVGRHQVGRELDALASMPEHDAQGLDQLGLGEAGHADQQQVTAGQQRNQRLIDDLLLAINDLADGGARLPQLAAQPLDIGQGGEGVGVARGRSVGGHLALHCCR